MESLFLRQIASSAELFEHQNVLHKDKSTWKFSTRNLQGELLSAANALCASIVEDTENEKRTWPKLMAELEVVLRGIDKAFMGFHGAEMESLLIFWKSQDHNDMEKVVQQYQNSMPFLDHLKKDMDSLLPRFFSILTWCNALPQTNTITRWQSAYASFKSQREDAGKARAALENRHVVEQFSCDWLSGLVVDRAYTEQGNPRRTVEWLHSEHRKGNKYSRSNTLFYQALPDTLGIKAIIRDDDLSKLVGKPTDSLAMNIAEVRGEEVHFLNEKGVEGSSDYMSTKMEGDRKENFKKVLRAWARLQAIEVVLREPDSVLGSYKREELFEKQASQVLDLQNRVQATLNLVEFVANHLEKIKTELAMAQEVVEQLSDGLQDAFCNLCADDLEEAVKNKAKCVERSETLGTLLLSLEHKAVDFPPKANHAAGRKNWNLAANPQPSASPPSGVQTSQLVYGLSYLDFDRENDLSAFLPWENDNLKVEPKGKPFQLCAAWLQIPEHPHATGRNYIQTGSKRFDVGRNVGVEISNGKFHFENHRGFHDFRTTIRFPKAYDERVKPKIVCYFQGLEVKRDHNTWIEVEAFEVDNLGFELQLRTAKDAPYPSVADMGWISYVPFADGPRVWSDRLRFTKRQEARETLPQSVSFPQDLFSGVPGCTALIGKLRSKAGHNWRLDVCIQEVTSKYVRFTGRCWDTSEITDVEVSMIAVEGPPRTWQLKGTIEKAGKVDLDKFFEEVRRN